MGNDGITAILQSRPFTEGFWPEHLAQLSAVASEVRFRPGELVSPGPPVRVATLYAGAVLGCSISSVMRAILKVMSARMHASRAQLVNIYSPLAAAK
jgi:hypothetical protein